MGQYWGWFISPYFLPWFILFAIFFAGFVGWGLLARQPLFNLRMFAHRNFALGIALKIVFSMNLYGLLGLLSPYMINLRGYQWWQGALVFVPAWLVLFAFLSADLAWGERLDRRLRLCLGLALMAGVTWRLGVVDVYTSKFWLAGWLAVWGAGAGLVLVPIMLTIFEGVPAEQTAQVAGLYNITRTQPAFLAATLLATFWVQTSDNNFDRVRLNITHNRPIVADSLRHPERHFNARGSPRTFQPRQSRAFLTQWVHANARAWAFGSVLRLLALVTAVALVPAILVRRPGKEAGEPWT